MGRQTDTKSSTSKTKPIGAEAILIRLPMMLKRISLNYTENHNTILPGYLLKPKFIGQDFSANAPGWDFIFGYQPDTAWPDMIRQQKDGSPTIPRLNYPFVQNATKNFSMKGSFEPFKDLLIDSQFQ
jgi:cell surface protein SprA